MLYCARFGLIDGLGARKNRNQYNLQLLGFMQTRFNNFCVDVAGITHSDMDPSFTHFCTLPSLPTGWILFASQPLSGSCNLTQCSLIR